jgi:hypothetical protein
MKKIVAVVIALLLTGIFVPAKVDAKPLWVKLKIGIFAKWSITFTGNCDDGKGLCLTFGGNAAPGSTPNFFGYDDEMDKFYIKVFKQWGSAKPFSNSTFEVQEDSQVDPKLIENMSNFKFNTKKVIIKSGIYPVSDEQEFYIMPVDYYLE